MKKINFKLTKCTNSECGFRIIADPVKKNCPICGHRMVRDNTFEVLGFEKENDNFLGFKKRKHNANNNRFKKTKNKKS